MQTKHRKKLFIMYFLSLLLFKSNLNAEEFNITAKEILIDKANEILIGKGAVQAVDSEGKIINADKITYQKTEEFLLAEGNVDITDIEGNILKTNKATYDKRIPIMILKYFKDMEETFNGLAHHLKSNSIVCIDIGDSKFCGIHIPTDVLLRKFAEKKYFQYKETIKLRSRLSHDKSRLKQCLIVLRRNKEIVRSEISKIHSLLPKW